jgi:hypothetical protein
VTRWGTLSGEPFTFDKDVIPGRKWRVAWGWLEVDAMGGWKPVFEVADSTDLARKLAWLSGANVTHRAARTDRRLGAAGKGTMPDEAAATLLAIGRFIADTPGAKTYDEAVKLRG